MGIPGFSKGLLCLFFICVPSLSKRLTIGDLDVKTNVNECERCKVLTDSFNYWLEKTSRGKYEGGDAAWEETKLKSYARSEIRLVEIQEGLCSEVKKHQDYCYKLSEEAEQLLEKWWFLDDPSSSNLHSWLCIETFKYCCPPYHYGELCSPCPLDNNNEICSGNGKCDGEATRKGNGSCICKKGYIGKYCEDCAENYYYADVNSSCKPCHISCNGCTGEGATFCLKCKNGWHLEDGVCVDIDECMNLSICKDNQFCINKEGSYACKMCDKSCKTCLGLGSSNCTSCETTNYLWSGQCLDEKMKSDLYTNTLKHTALCSGLLIIAFFIFRHSKILAAFVVLIMSIYIYFSKKTLKLIFWM